VSTETELIHAVVVLRERGRSQREIADALGLSRAKVRRILERVQRQRDEGASALRAPRLTRKSKLDPFEPAMEELLDKYSDITGVRMHEELEALGFDGGLTIVKERLRRLRKEPKQKPVIRFETEPGEQGQQDWSPYTLDFTQTGKQQVRCFSLVLAFSRRQYIDFDEHEGFFPMIRHHVAAFEYFEGVPAEILYDNQKAVVDRREAGQPIYNPRFLAFATHYGFRPRALPPRTPEWKGKVERPFQYVEGNCLNARTFRDLSHLRDHARWWMRNVSDPHKHGTTGESPIDRFARERSQLRGLPAGAYDTAEVGYVVASNEGFVRWETVQYSVPWEHILEVLVVRDTGEEIVIYASDLSEVARHEKVSPKTSERVPVVDPLHHPRKPRRNDIEQLTQKMVDLGEIAEEFATGVLRTQRYRGAQLAHVLGLLDRYSADDLLSAMKRAVRYKAFDSKTVQRILERTAEPRALPDTLEAAAAARLAEVARQSNVHPRPMSDYARAFGGLPPQEEE